MDFRGNSRGVSNGHIPNEATASFPRYQCSNHRTLSVVLARFDGSLQLVSVALMKARPRCHSLADAESSFLTAPTAGSGFPEFLRELHKG